MCSQRDSDAIRIWGIGRLRAAVARMSSAGKFAFINGGCCDFIEVIKIVFVGGKSRLMD
jgi:hypothetical protein